MRDAEFQLVVAACSASFSDRPIEPPPAGVHWDRILRIAGRHRVQALCWEALKPFAEGMPAEVAVAFHAQARQTILANLRTVTKCRRIREAFTLAGIPLLFLKGLTLGALAYRNPLLKMSVDIDLLVEQGRLGEAAEVLRSSGYSVVIPAWASNQQFSRWHATRKESVWRHAEEDFQIDLHTRVADHPAVLPELSVSSPFQDVPIVSGIALPTFASDELFAYLCVHGASSAWFRLKWITDLSALLNGKDSVEIARLYRRSQELGAGRAAGQALLLARQIHGVELGEDLRQRLAADPVIRWMVRIAERQLHNRDEPTDRPMGTAGIHLSQLGLLPGWRFTSSEVVRQLSDIWRTGAKQQ